MVTSMQLNPYETRTRNLITAAREAKLTVKIMREIEQRNQLKELIREVVREELGRS